VGLSGWFMDLLGKLMRDAVVLASDCLVSQPKVEDSDDDLFSSISCELVPPGPLWINKYRHSVVRFTAPSPTICVIEPTFCAPTRQAVS